MVNEQTTRPTRRLGRLVLLAGVVAIVAATAVVLVGRGRLEAGNDEIDRRWIPLRADFAVRYQKLDTLNHVFREQISDTRRIDREIGRLLDRWERLLRTSVAERAIDEEGEAATAKALELEARRLVLRVYHETRDAPIMELNQALANFARSPLPTPELPRYNQAVVDYEATRDSIVGAPAAHLLAYYGRSKIGLTT